MSIVHGVRRRVEQVGQARAVAGGQHLGRKGRQVTLAGGCADVFDIDHDGKWLDIVDVRGATAVDIACGLAVEFSILIEVGEVIPMADLGCAPIAGHRIVCRIAQGSEEEVILRTVHWMGHVGDIEDAQSGLPVGAVDEGAIVSRVVHVLSRPLLHSHVVDVDPTAPGGLPI